MSGIETFTPLVHEVVIDGHKIAVAPLKARAFAQVQVLSKPVMARLTMERFGELVAEGHDDLCRLLSAATGAEREWLDEQDGDDLLGLYALVVEVNADFTHRRIGPALGRLAMAVERALRPSGAASSPVSAPSGTPSEPPST